MAGERPKRRIAAILAADIVGYSRLMEQDESGTLATLKARRRSLLDPLVAHYQGRIFKVVGDGVLIEFASAVNAVQCAVDLQQGMAAANSDVSQDRQIVLRVGINLGVILVVGDDLYGEAVNIAARLEGIAEPGSILLSGTAYDHIKNKIKAGFDDLGPQSLKNITEPVRTYRVAALATDVAAPKAASEKPSIAVLPFTNMSGDPEQQYFSDGITEDIITELARFHSLLVIARNSSFQYRDKAIDVKRVGRELGARYIVEGSVRKIGSRIRITAQLVDAATGSHLWAEHYDRELQDIFAIQDEVVTTIIGRMVGQVETAGIGLLRRKRTENLAAYDYLLHGIECMSRYDIAGLEQALLMFRNAIALDPDFAQAYAKLSMVLVNDYWARAYGMLGAGTLRDEAIEAGKKAVALDSSDAQCHQALAHAYLCRRSFDLADYHLGMATRLNPNDSELVAHRAWFELCAGRPNEALAWLDQAVQLNPNPRTWYWDLRGLALYHLRRYADALSAFERISSGPVYIDRFRAACHAQLGQLDEAHAIVAQALTRDPDFSLRQFALVEPYKSRADLDHMIDGMRKAGLPE
jgi:TolB-like protein/Tfp pilus assembly protein PilF